jgi:hypothetical protein
MQTAWFPDVGTRQKKMAHLVYLLQYYGHQERCGCRHECDSRVPLVASVNRQRVRFQFALNS